MKFCKFCNVEHPETAEYWFKNGGKFRKCKNHYALYEKRRSKLRGHTLEPKQRHKQQLLNLEQFLISKGFQVFTEVKLKATRADLFLPEFNLLIELKTNPVPLPRVLFRYRHTRDQHRLLVVTTKTQHIDNIDDSPAHLVIQEWLGTL